MVRQAQLRAEVRARRGAQADERGGLQQGQPLKTKFVVASGGTGQMLSLPMNEAIQEMFKDVYIDLEFKVVELEAL